MGQSLVRIDESGLSCNGQSTPIKEVFKKGMEHQARYSPNGAITIHYKLKEGNNVNLQVFNLLGQPVTTLTNTYQSAGEYNVLFQSQRKRLARGQYFYKIQVGHQVFTDAFLLR